MKLNNITLISVCGNEDYLSGTVKAMRYCMKDIEFESVKLLSNKVIPLADIEVIEIPELNIEQYSVFCLYELPSYIQTEFCLTVQHDGFVINPQLWNDRFYYYDYIGAPWGYTPERSIIYTHHNYVGNGGFSLRSQKFLQSAKTLKYNSKIKFQAHIPAGSLPTPEDWFVCTHSYRKMLDMNVKFADPRTAYQFSVEHATTLHSYNVDDINTYRSFGFHGKFNTAAMKLLEDQ